VRVPNAAVVAGIMAGLVVFAGCAGPRAWRRGSELASMSAEERARYAQQESRLDSANAAERRQAAVALLAMGRRVAIRAVLDAMRNADRAEVRASMVEAAAFSRDHRCFEAVLAAVADPDPQVQKEAARALASFTRPEEVEAMVAAVRRRDIPPSQRQMLFQALGEALALKAVPVLLEGLNAKEEAVRVAAWEALRRISGRQLPLEAAQWRRWWEANKDRTREQVLEEHLRALASALQARSEELNSLLAQQQELLALVSSGESETPARLMSALGSRHEAVRQYASFRLAALGKAKGTALSLDQAAGLDALRQALGDPSVQVRLNVLRFVVAADGKHRQELIYLALQDEDARVLSEAINAVQVGAAPEVVARLEQLLGQSRDPQVREAAANALGKVGSADSVPALLAALDDKAENVRWFAIEGLRKLRATQAVPRISEMVQTDPSARVREIAATALGELGQPAAVPALRKALDDSNERVRQKAVSALLALAAENYERMKIIADTFAEHKLSDPAKTVLQRIIDTYAGQEEMKDKLVEAHRSLARILKQQGDPAAAARIYQKLDALTGGAVQVRTELVDCWLQGGELPRVVGAFDRWLGEASDEQKGPLMALALDSAERLFKAGNQKEGAALLDLVEKAAGEEADQALKERIAKLRKLAAP